MNRLASKPCRTLTQPKATVLSAKLAAGGVQLQDRHGQLSHPGVSADEMAFSKAPKRMEALLLKELPGLLPGVQLQRLQHRPCRGSGYAGLTDDQPQRHLDRIPEVSRQQALQTMLERLMHKLLEEAKGNGLNGSFFLHVAPNLGRNDVG